MEKKNVRRDHPLGLYLHIPFCKAKCAYCDFYSLARSEEKMDAYTAALQRHLVEVAPQADCHIVDTVYFGGGTPSYLGVKRLTELLKTVKKHYRLAKEPEITVEANPDSACDWKALRALRRAGVNRLSLGVQSTDDALLQAIGRVHTFAQVQETVAAARRAKIKNLSLDLIYGLPGQTMAQWEETLQDAVDLQPEHLSCYGLKLEPGTPLFARQGELTFPDDDAQADMYFYAVQTLEQFGYHQYEISNFAKDGFICRHNMKYWTGDEYLGFGPCAASDFAGKRFTIQADLQKYLDGVKTKGVILSECDTIPLRERAGEYLMLRLRTVDGIEEGEYTKSFLLPFEPLQKVLEKLAKNDLCIQNGSRWRLTPKGFMLSNQVILTLLEAQQRSKPLAQRR